MEEITQFIKYTSRISAILPLIVYFTSKSFAKKYINLLAILLSVSLLADMITIFLVIHGITNYVVANLYFIVEFVLISLIYSSIYKEISIGYHKSLMTAGFVIIFCNSVFWQNITSIQNITWLGNCFLMAAMAFGHFAYILKHPIIKLRSFAPYWITIGLLFYCCSSFIILGFINVFIKNLENHDFGIIWAVHNINNIIKNIFFLFAIFWAPRRESFLQVFNAGQN